MSYYFVVDDDPEFLTIKGPYRNKDDLLDGLNDSFGFTVFDRKKDAQEFIEE